jgi:hypothetical protein
LNDEEVLAFAIGRLPASRLPEAHQHFDQCETCQHLLSEAAHALATAATVPLHDGEELGWRTTFRPGTLVGQRYLIRQFITRGGMGEVYEAFDQDLQERVALKTVTSTACDSPSAADGRAALRVKLLSGRCGARARETRRTPAEHQEPTRAARSRYDRARLFAAFAKRSLRQRRGGADGAECARKWAAFNVYQAATVADSACARTRRGCVVLVAARAAEALEPTGGHLNAGAGVARLDTPRGGGKQSRNHARRVVSNSPQAAVACIEAKLRT